MCFSVHFRARASLCVIRSVNAGDFACLCVGLHLLLRFVSVCVLACVYLCVFVCVSVPACVCLGVRVC